MGILLTVSSASCLFIRWYFRDWKEVEEDEITPKAESYLLNGKSVQRVEHIWAGRSPSNGPQGPAHKRAWRVSGSTITTTEVEVFRPDDVEAENEDDGDETVAIEIAEAAEEEVIIEELENKRKEVEAPSITQIFWQSITQGKEAEAPSINQDASWAHSREQIDDAKYKKRLAELCKSDLATAHITDFFEADNSTARRSSTTEAQGRRDSKQHSRGRSPAPSRRSSKDYSSPTPSGFLRQAAAGEGGALTVRSSVDSSMNQRSPSKQSQIKQGSPAAALALDEKPRVPSATLPSGLGNKSSQQRSPIKRSAASRSTSKEPRQRVPSNVPS